MAARKRSAIKAGGMSEAWRERIQATVLINILNKHINGEKVLEKSQVTAALGLLKKVAPDLQAVTHSGDKENPLEMFHNIAPDLTKKLDRLSDR